LSGNRNVSDERHRVQCNWSAETAVSPRHERLTSRDGYPLWVESSHPTGLLMQTVPSGMERGRGIAGGPTLFHLRHPRLPV
jgi:hypothetical protein